MRDEVESRLNIIITPRQSEDLILIESKLSLQAADPVLNEEVECIKNRFGNTIFDSTISSDCINCYRKAAKENISTGSVARREEKVKKRKLFYFNFI